ncbi:MAG: GyrI-like domain-containing protein [Clostridiales bacterium]
MSEKYKILESVDEQYVLSIRTRTSISNLPKELGKAFNTISEYLIKLGEKPSDAPFTGYYNMDMEDLDVEIGFPVSKELPGQNIIKSNTIPKGKQAVGIHKGSYSTLKDAYKDMSDFIIEKGYNYTDVKIAYEFYLNSPMEVKEEELLTKIVFLLK